jgi:hypothetical protein
MGYFANLYLVDASIKGATIEVEESVFGGEVGNGVYFSWAKGERPDGMFPYAHGTMFSDKPLELLRGYPVKEVIKSEEGNGPPQEFLLEAQFTPFDRTAPVVFHVLLPQHYVPLKTRTPFTQPCEPSVLLWDDRIVATFPAEGPATLRFWVGLRQTADPLNTYDLPNMFHPEPRRHIKTEFEVSIPFFKWKFGE